jgi:dTDP-4-dehydrorhamnose reductase
MPTADSRLLIAITGAAGLLGRGLTQRLSERHTLFPLTRQDLDITNSEQAHHVFAKLKPQIVIHSAASPDIDWCELHPEEVWRINAEGTRVIRDAAHAAGATLALISTDAVFDGTPGPPWRESDPPNAKAVYGKTKIAAENYTRENPEHWIFRVSVLFGPGKINFVEKGLRAIQHGETYPAASDQLGTATYTLDAADLMDAIFRSGRYGTFHVANSGACTRYELASKAAEFADLDSSKVLARTRAEMNRPGPRNANAVMDLAGLVSAGIAPPRHWSDALRDYISQLQL